MTKTDKISKSAKNIEAIQKHRNKMKSLGFVWRTFRIHSTLANEINEVIKAKNKEIESKAYLASLTKSL